MVGWDIGIGGLISVHKWFMMIAYLETKIGFMPCG